MNPPTDRQVEVLRLIADYTRQHGHPPTVRELCVVMGVTGTNSASDVLRALERKRLIKRTPGVSRGTRITATGLRLLGESGLDDAQLLARVRAHKDAATLRDLLLSDAADLGPDASELWQLLAELIAPRAAEMVGAA